MGRFPEFTHTGKSSLVCGLVTIELDHRQSVVIILNGDDLLLKHHQG